MASGQVSGQRAEGSGAGVGAGLRGWPRGTPARRDPGPARFASLGLEAEGPGVKPGRAPAASREGGGGGGPGRPRQVRGWGSAPGGG